MQRLPRFCLLALFVAAILTGGCSSKAKPASTPKQAVINMILSVENKNLDQYMECFEVDKENYVYFKHSFDYMVAMYDFCHAMDKTYGQWRFTELHKQGQLNLGSPPTPEDVETKATAEVKGDTAVVSQPNPVTSEPMRAELKKVGGTWKIVAFQEPPPAAMLEEIGNEIQGITAAMKTVRWQIGQPGTTPEKIEILLMQELSKSRKITPADSQPVSNNGSSSQRAKVSAAKTDIASISAALDNFEVDCGRYPTTEEGLPILFTHPTNANNWKGPYLDKSETPRDPWGHPYAYRCPGSHNTNGYDLYSFGPDGQECGGDDIDNWTKK